jgi:hypothetical protein
MNYKFKGVFIPAQVWLDPRLSPTQKFLLAEIDAMSDGEKYPCYASNKHFAKHLQVSEGGVRNMLAKLIEIGYVKRIYKDAKASTGRSLWVDFASAKEPAKIPEETPQNEPAEQAVTPPASYDAPPAPEDAPPCTVGCTLNKLLNKPRKEEEEEEEGDGGNITFKTQTDFVRYIREHFIGVPIPIADNTYYIASDGKLKVYENNNPVAGGMARDLYRRMHAKSGDVIAYLADRRRRQ